MKNTLKHMDTPPVLSRGNTSTDSAVVAELRSMIQAQNEQIATLIAALGKVSNTTSKAVVATHKAKNDQPTITYNHAELWTKVQSAIQADMARNTPLYGKYVYPHMLAYALAKHAVKDGCMLQPKDTSIVTLALAYKLV